MLSPVTTGIGDDLWQVYHHGNYPGHSGNTQPGHLSVGRCNEYRRWFRQSLGRNGASEVTTPRRFI